MGQVQEFCHQMCWERDLAQSRFKKKDDGRVGGGIPFCCCRGVSVTGEA